MDGDFKSRTHLGIPGTCIAHILSGRRRLALSPGDDRSRNDAAGRPGSGTSAAEGPEYAYYRSQAEVEGRNEESLRAARTLSRTRLDPWVGNPDYLLLKQRRRHFESWLAELPTGSLDILDVGGRIQPYRNLLEARCRSYIAIDLQLEGLADVVANGAALPFADESFDACLCTQVLSYTPGPTDVVTEMMRVLRPGGTAFVSAPAFFPEHHDEYWRLLPAGFRHLFAEWDAVRVLPEGSSAIGVIRTLNLVLLRSRNRILHAFASRVAVPLLNRTGRLVLSRGKTADAGFMTANYCLTARKPARAMDGCERD